MHMRSLAGRIVNSLGIDGQKLFERIGSWSIDKARRQNGLEGLVERLRSIVPDISHQEESEKTVFNDYVELKRRTLQAFQCRMMLRALDGIGQDRATTVVDIGDSAGTHMLYLSDLSSDRQVETISVNLDPRAIKKIKARGLNAILCRAEDLDLGNKKIDLFTSFEMVEHLHNPAIFFHRLALRSSCETILVTVPYRKTSRVGLYSARYNSGKRIFAEDEHIFELSPEDWSLLLLHSGWRVRSSEIYYQYPRRLPIISLILGLFWRHMDFEGFWGAILDKDMTISECYQDWEA